MPRCLDCESVYFKTLEIRALTGRKEPPALLYKKRCKRCKTKQFVKKNITTGAIELTTYEDFCRGDRIAGAYELNNDRFRMMVSQYTRRISRPADEQIRWKKGGAAYGG